MPAGGEPLSEPKPAPARSAQLPEPEPASAAQSFQRLTSPAPPLQVYGIIAAQLALTAVVAAFIIFNPPVQQALAASLWAQVLLILLSLVGLIPLYIYQDRHPANLVFLGLWTTVMAVSVGMACSFYQPYIVLEAVALTASIVAGLTLYSFYAVRRGVDFSWMGPFVFASLWALIAWGVIQLFFSPGPVAR